MGSSHLLPKRQIILIKRFSCYEQRFGWDKRVAGLLTDLHPPSTLSPILCMPTQK